MHKRLARTGRLDKHACVNGMRQNATTALCDRSIATASRENPEENILGSLRSPGQFPQRAQVAEPSLASVTSKPVKVSNYF